MSIALPARPVTIPNVADLEEARRAFSWEDARAALDGLPSGGINIAYEAVDRHARGPRADRVALRCLGRLGSRRDITYAGLAAASNRFANALDHLRVGTGETVFALCPRIPELYVAALGTLKHRSVFCPLYPAFGPEPIQTRLHLGDARVLVTTHALYERKLAPIRHHLPGLHHVIFVDDHWRMLVDSQPSTYQIGETVPETPALLHFTSGTTGRPKGAIHVHNAVIAHHATARMVLDLHDDDVFWCTADPGWVTGTSYGWIAPLTCGVTSVIDEGDFGAERWYRILADHRVSVWYTAPTAIRMLMKAGAELPRRFDLSALRVAASVGEPLHPEGVIWGKEVLGRPFLDNWWQTETGGIMIANFPSMEVRPGAMGKPIPGIDASVVELEGETVHELGADQVGQLALRRGWPSMFRGYLHEDARYRRCFADGWYLTGDLVRRDADGYYWFVGRADDVIKSAGHLIGPFEVEQVLLAHPAVAEAAVIGLPDPIAGELVHAYVSIKPGSIAGDALRTELLAHARTRLGPAVAPREITILDDLPRTRSGKLMRRLLKARALGLPEGDTSTLEQP